MNAGKVRLILQREIRDQLRDRRTLFMIFVLPIMLYPLLGTCFFQIAQFRQEKPTRIAVVGVEQLAKIPPLFENGRIAAGLLEGDDAAEPGLLQLEFLRAPAGAVAGSGNLAAEARRQVEAGVCDAAVCFPADFAARLGKRDQDGRKQSSPPAPLPTNLRLVPGEGKVGEAESLQVEILHSTSTDKSLIAFNRLKEVLQRWSERIVADKLAARGISPEVACPFVPHPVDLASRHGAIAWSKILPVLLLVWALTGAFYPAIDLCAGEKERGTMETLLCSPARRSEIVLGKLLTIMLFSMITAALNLLSIGLTGGLLLSGRMPGFAAPPCLAALWLALALVPLSALFSALSLALAAFARSTKEGQYYLMPLLLVTMPLTVLSTMPGMELNLGTSLIPITGMVLLLRNLLVGSYWSAVPFVLPVLGVTLLCCLLAIRWAVEQFNSESVLFRESERLDLGLWLRHLFRDREPTPTVAGAVFCVVMILSIKFFMGLAIAPPSGFAATARVALITQVAVILAPVLLMTVMLASSPRQTLLLRWPRWSTIPAAVLLAVALHPLVMRLTEIISRVYEMNSEVKKSLSDLMGGSPNLAVLLLVVAVVPPICEELAFRGFILSGFRHLGHTWRAVIYSAVCFGLTHAIIQQSILASLVGIVLGILAVRTESLLPCIVFHMTHNALAVAASQMQDLLQRFPQLRMLVALDADQRPLYHWGLVAAGGALAAIILVWLLVLPYGTSNEEKLQAAIRRQNRLPESAVNA